MTREENLHWLNVEIWTWENECQSKHPIKEALYAARKALEQEPILEKDGTLIVTTEHYENVGRVLVQYGTNGALFYQDREPTTKNDLRVDCISREDALMCLTGMFGNREYEPSELIKIFARRIKTLPSVTPQEHRWIPINERLPEDRRPVLVTAYWHETYQVMMASYYGDGLWWCVPFNNCGEHMQSLKPKAWMPLPKPYKAESEGEDK